MYINTEKREDQLSTHLDEYIYRFGKFNLENSCKKMSKKKKPFKYYFFNLKINKNWVIKLLDGQWRKSPTWFLSPSSGKNSNKPLDIKKKNSPSTKKAKYSCRVCKLFLYSIFFSSLIFIYLFSIDNNIIYKILSFTALSRC